MQNPFKFAKEMDGLQSALSGLPTAGVYALGAVLVAALGGGASIGASNVVPGSCCLVFMRWWAAQQC